MWLWRTVLWATGLIKHFVLYGYKPIKKTSYEYMKSMAKRGQKCAQKLLWSFKSHLTVCFRGQDLSLTLDSLHDRIASNEPGGSFLLWLDCICHFQASAASGDVRGGLKHSQRLLWEGDNFDRCFPYSCTFNTSNRLLHILWKLPSF